MTSSPLGRGRAGRDRRATVPPRRYARFLVDLLIAAVGLGGLYLSLLRPASALESVTAAAVILVLALAGAAARCTRIRPIVCSLLPYLPLTILLTVEVAQNRRGSASNPDLFMVALAAVGLTLVRQSLTLQDNRRLVDEISQGRTVLDRQARQDPVTGLSNRAEFTVWLAEALARRARSGRSLAVLLCDVDSFTSINDGLGQGFGDRVLATVGSRIRSQICEPKPVARLGGDEFAILVEDLDPLDAGRQMELLATRVQAATAEPCRIDGIQVSLGIAVGLVLVHPEQRIDWPDEVLSRADVAMRVAQSTRTRRPVIHHEGLTLPDGRDWLLRPAFERALGAGLVRPHFQPLVDLATGNIRAFEALARWEHNGRLTKPGVFLPVAERAGLIPALFEQILRGATFQCAQWRRLPAHRNLQVAVNVSPQQLSDPLFPDLVERVLCETGMMPSGLIVEMTEHCLLEDPDAARRVIHRLRHIGVTVWLDDFGAGYSSLALLHRLPLQAIKLDRALVRQIDSEVALNRVVTGLVSLSRDLGLEVVGEGIQRVEQAEALRKAGCTLGQGYLFAPPVPAQAGRSVLDRSPARTVGDLVRPSA